MPRDFTAHDSGHFGKSSEVEHYYKFISCQGQGSQFMKEAVGLKN